MPITRPAMSDKEAKGMAQGQRIQEYCRNIYGAGDYDIEFENVDHWDYYIYVRRDYGTHFGHMLTNSGVCNTEEKAIANLERILSIESKHARSGVPMTKAELIDCYGLKTGAALHKLNGILERDPTILERPHKKLSEEQLRNMPPMIRSFFETSQKNATMFPPLQAEDMQDLDDELR